MKGLFGGILGLVNAFGGAVLTILIGRVAWRHGARWARIIVGSFALGLLIGVMVYVISAPAMPTVSTLPPDYGSNGELVDVASGHSITEPSPDQVRRRSMSFWSGIVMFVTVLLLEGLRLKLEGEALEGGMHDG
jgi:hypothetical protein